mmetsp:Transcript_7944/g.22152  ORF Transcript_7944/g.22152 Transcript_7944/m.22152 type:complete len:370 (-) Transcript_7944:122-1231(-)
MRHRPVHAGQRPAVRSARIGGGGPSLWARQDGPVRPLGLLWRPVRHHALDLQRLLSAQIQEGGHGRDAPAPHRRHASEPVPVHRAQHPEVPVHAVRLAGLVEPSAHGGRSRHLQRHPPRRRPPRHHRLPALVQAVERPAVPLDGRPRRPSHPHRGTVHAESWLRPRQDEPHPGRPHQAGGERRHHPGWHRGDVPGPQGRGGGLRHEAQGHRQDRVEGRRSHRPGLRLWSHRRLDRRRRSVRHPRGALQPVRGQPQSVLRTVRVVPRPPTADPHGRVPRRPHPLSPCGGRRADPGPHRRVSRQDAGGIPPGVRHAQGRVRLGGQGAALCLIPRFDQECSQASTGPWYQHHAKMALTRRSHLGPTHLACAE